MAAERPSEGSGFATAGTGRSPLVSVVVACLNAATTIRACVTSVLEQEGGLAELLVLDGGSEDGTLEVLDEFRERLAYFRSRSDRGVYFAWNDAIGHVRGEWIYFLGADDVMWTPDVFLRLAPILRSADSAVSIVYGPVAFLDSSGQEMAVVGRPWREAVNPFFRGGNLCHQGVFHRRSLFGSRRFDTSFRILGDYDFLLGVLSTSEPLFVPDVVVAGYSTGGMSSRPGNFLRSLRENHRALRKNGRGPGFWRRQRQYLGALCAVVLVRGASRLSENLKRRALARVLLGNASMTRTRCR